MATNRKELQKAKCDDPTVQLARLTIAANEDARKMDALKAFLAENPGIMDKVSVLAGSVKTGLIDKMAGQEGSRLVFQEEYAAMVKRLGAADASQLERLMITRVAMSWLRVMYAENACTILMGQQASFKQLDYLDKQLTRAHSRYMKAIEALARLRKLQANSKAANAQASILEMREKTMRARIEAAHPGLLSGDRGLNAVLKGALKAG